MVTGSSVIGVVYNGGVMLAADTLLSYGTMAKSNNGRRMHCLTGTSTLIGASGEYSDYQQLVRVLEAEALQDTRTGIMDSLYSNEDSVVSPFTAVHTWNYLRMVMYQKRSKYNPYWNDLLVAGTDATGSRPFLGSVDKLGTTVQENYIATGFGAYLAMPLLREKWHANLTEGEARALLEDCLTICYYRDCRASPFIQLAKCAIVTDADGKSTSAAVISEPYKLETQWMAKEFVQPVGNLVDGGDGGW
jgi:20S proteasome subunit beta 7